MPAYHMNKEHWNMVVIGSDMSDEEIKRQVAKSYDLIKPKARKLMGNERVYKMKVATVYPLLVQKAERKGRTKEEVDTVTCWLAGYDERGLQSQIAKDVDYETFFAEAPRMNPNAAKIKGVVCGIRVEDIDDPLIQKVRWLDKLVDELAKGKSIEKILRS